MKRRTAAGPLSFTSSSVVAEYTLRLQQLCDLCDNFCLRTKARVLYFVIVDLIVPIIQSRLSTITIEHNA